MLLNSIAVVALMTLSCSSVYANPVAEEYEEVLEEDMRIVATPDGRYHIPSCTATGSNTTPGYREDARQKEYVPCDACNPR